jgi:hypothetical protein
VQVSRERRRMERGRGGRAETHICIPAPTRHLERAAQGSGARERGRPAALGAGGARGPPAGGARARSPPRPGRARDPGQLAPPPPGAAGRVVRLSRQTRESEAAAATWGTFPPSPGISSETHAREKPGPGRRRGRGGNFPLHVARRFGPRVPPGSRVPRGRGPGHSAGTGRGERAGRAGTGGRRRGARARASGGGGVQPYLGGFPLECTSSYFH